MKTSRTQIAHLCQSDAKKKQKENMTNSQKKQTTHQDKSHRTHEETLCHAVHRKATRSMFQHILVRPQVPHNCYVWRLWREQHICPLGWHQLLTELKSLSFESDHSREAYCYKRGLALVKTEQQKVGELNWDASVTVSKSTNILPHLKD